MLTHEQVVAYFEETLPPQAGADFEAELAANAAMAAEMIKWAQYDSALQTLIGGAVERARIEASVLAAIQKPSLQPDGAAPLSGHLENPMNDPNHNSDEINRSLLKDQLADQGIDVLSRSPGKDAQVAKELAEEATWGDKPKPSPPREAEAQGEDNDYYNGLSQ